MPDNPDSIDPFLEKLSRHPDRCPELGTPEHYALGGGRGPVYEPPRWTVQKRDDMYERLPNAD